MKKEEKKEAKKEEQAKEPLHWLVEPQSVLVHPPGELFQDAIILILLAVATYLVSIYLYAINFTFFFVRWGSLALLVLAIFTITYVLKMFAHLIHGITRLRKPYKFGIFIAVLLGAFFVIIYRDAIVPPFLHWLWNLPWRNINPFSFFWWYPAYWW
jgi:ABC-type multidrug transport system fused ATPase/permease subunit